MTLRPTRHTRLDTLFPHPTLFRSINILDRPKFAGQAPSPPAALFDYQGTFMSLSPFHLAIPVHDLPAARRFYGEVFGLEEGRSSAQWVDFNFYGHQLIIHEHPKTASQAHVPTNPVDGHEVTVPHSGVVQTGR